MLMRCFLFLFPCALCRYDILSDGLEDIAVDNNLNTQTLEDEEALDPIDDDDSDIWQAKGNNGPAEDKSAQKYKLRRKDLAGPYAYAPLNNNCDSIKTWSTTRFSFMSASKATIKV